MVYCTVYAILLTLIPYILLFCYPNISCYSFNIFITFFVAKVHEVCPNRLLEWTIQLRQVLHMHEE